MEEMKRGVLVPNPSAAGELLELLPRRERVAACRPGDGLGVAPVARPGRASARWGMGRLRNCRESYGGGKGEGGEGERVLGSEFDKPYDFFYQNSKYNGIH